LDTVPAIVAALREADVRLATSLPDDWITPLIGAVEAEEAIRHVPVGRESEAVMVASGAFLGGMNAVALMGATGLMTCTGELATLNLRHQIPVFILCSQRGSMDDHRVYQEVQGRRLPDVLKAYDFMFTVIDDEEGIVRLPDAYETCRLQKRPYVAFLTKRLLKGTR
jgi:sulfopyruvate decarboxylase TPP-binding subunit